MKIEKFDVAEFLDSKEMIAEYLTQTLQDGDINALLQALGNVAKALGMSEIARITGLGRESLYKVFKSGAKPKFETVFKIIQAFDLKIQVLP